MKLSDLKLDVDIDLGEIRKDAQQEIVDQLINHLKKCFLEDMIKDAKVEIHKRIGGLIEETLSQEFCPVNDWGQPKAEKTTIREMFKENAAKWWNQMVNGKGELKTGFISSHDKPRYEYLARKLIAEIMENELKKDLENIYKEAKEKLREGLAKALAEQMVKF